MEPQHGHVWVERPNRTPNNSARGASPGGGSFWMSDKVIMNFGIYCL